MSLSPRHRTSPLVPLALHHDRTQVILTGTAMSTYIVHLVDKSRTINLLYTEGTDGMHWINKALSVVGYIELIVSQEGGNVSQVVSLTKAHVFGRVLPSWKAPDRWSARLQKEGIVGAT
jgi:hypothetical protein